MSNARIILHAIGEQDNFLNRNAENSFFKRDIRTYTQFGTDWIIVSNNDRNDSNFIYDGMKMDVHVPLNGDVLTEVYLRIKLDASANWDFSDASGSLSSKTYALETIMNIFDKIEFMYNNVVISEIDSLYLLSYYDLYLSRYQKSELVPLISYEYAKRGSIQSGSNTEFVYLYVPIPFWFHKTPLNSFPLWALKDNNVSLKVSLKRFKGPSGRKIRDVECLFQYAFLTPEEKEKFTNLPLEYTVKQVIQIDKFRAYPVQSRKVTIPQTFYIEQMLWNIALYEKDNSGSDYYGFRKLINGLQSARIDLNGNMLVESDNAYFNYVQRFQHFTCDSAFKLISYSNIANYRSNLIPSPYETREIPLPIYTYSFGLDPVSNKETGFLTTEKFGHSQITLQFNSMSEMTLSDIQFAECQLYAVRHNILRIQNGSLNILFS
jgi:hypothetical protein